MQPTPLRLNLKKDEKLEIEWQDGQHSVYPLTYLRTMCPCALCRTVREETKAKKSLLHILPGNFADPLTALWAKLSGMGGRRRTNRECLSPGNNFSLDQP